MHGDMEVMKRREYLKTDGCRTKSAISIALPLVD